MQTIEGSVKQTQEAIYAELKARPKLQDFRSRLVTLCRY